MKTWQKNSAGVLLCCSLAACGDSDAPAAEGDAVSATADTRVSVRAGSLEKTYSFALDCLNMDPMFQFTANEPEAGLRLAAVSPGTGNFNLDLTIDGTSWILNSRAEGASFTVEGNSARISGQADVIAGGKKDRTEEVDVTIECR